MTAFAQKKLRPALAADRGHRDAVPVRREVQDHAERPDHGLGGVVLCRATAADLDVPASGSKQALFAGAFAESASSPSVRRASGGAAPTVDRPG
jgi:hypothetical protein